MKSKTPQEILDELDNMMTGDIETPKYFPRDVSRQFVHSSMQSLLLHIMEEMPKQEPYCNDMQCEGCTDQTLVAG